MEPEKRLSTSRAFVCCSNIIFMISGFVLISLGILLMIDSERILLSRLLGDHQHLDHPLFYYLAFSATSLGFIIAVIGLLGCWASCLFSTCINASYITMLVLLLSGELSFSLLAIFWPGVLGIDVNPERLVRELQRHYALPGYEQFTAALDLAQSTFSCCGINGSNNFGTSWWRLQEIGRRDFVVPLTCCTLNRTSNDPNEFYLNPTPVDVVNCQKLNPADHQLARNVNGCWEMIEDWAQNQALLVLTVGLILMLVELSALLSTFIACSKKKSPDSQREPSTFTSTQTLTHSGFPESDQDFGLEVESRMNMNKTGSTFSRKS